MNRGQAFAISALIISGCGGGGGGGGPTPTRPTIITAMVAPLLAPFSGAISPSAHMVIGANTTSTQPAILQSADYTLDRAAALAIPASIKLTTANIHATDTQGSTSITTGAAQPLDPTLGQITSIATTSRSGVYVPTLAGSPPATIISSTVSGISSVTLSDPMGATAGIALPYSAINNPTGYLYQTFGATLTTFPGGKITETYFSTGTPTTPINLPASGTATYTGRTTGTLVEATTRDISDVSAAMSATANFATRSVVFTTTGSASLSINAPIGALPTASPGLNMTGTLKYAAGNNTFSGPVSTANGMSGNATGRFYGNTTGQFYGPTGNLVTAPAGAPPPEIGGTFALAKQGVATLQGAFGGTSSNPPTLYVSGPTSISGTVALPPLPTSGISIVPSNPLSTMQTGPNATNSLRALVQSADYTPDPAAARIAPPSVRLTSANIKAIDLISTTISISTGAAQALDPMLGQVLSFAATNGPTTTTLSTPAATITANSAISGIPAVSISDPISGASVRYAQPYSATMNPAGFAYQTFGSWNARGPSSIISENYFSTGIPSMPAVLPTTGTATYSGRATATLVTSSSPDMSDVSAAMSATTNFAARSVLFTTTGSTSLSVNAAAGTLPTANPGLDMTGTLTYAAGENTFTGPVSTTNGMSGTAVGRFYGPDVLTATPNLPVGAPPEIGGTFAVMTPGVSAMQGAFGGSGNNPPSVVPAHTLLSGTVSAPTFLPPGNISFATNMLTPANSSNNQNSLSQAMSYSLGPAATPGAIQPIATLNMLPVTMPFAGFNFLTGAAYPLDPLLGQPSVASFTYAATSYQFSTSAFIGGANSTLGQSTLGGLPSITFSTPGGGITAEYSMPFSATMNPGGYTYQTFGHWIANLATGPAISQPGDFYFSAGASTAPATLPVAGTASYTGQAIGTVVDAIAQSMSKSTATMNATADFAARTVVFSTTGTATLPNNAAPGALPTANAGLNMTGTLSYATGNNTFTGAVTTTNGMTGSATGRFYGPGIAAATPTKVVGAPPEIGGTFAAMKTGAGGMAMQGAFGGK